MQSLAKLAASWAILAKALMASHQPKDQRSLGPRRLWLPRPVLG